MDYTDLVRQLKDGKGIDDRREAAMVISRNPSVQLLQPLIESLTDHEDVTIFTTLALVSIGKPAVPALLEHLRDPQERVRVACAEILGEIQDPESIPVLIDTLRQEASLPVKQSIVESLGRFHSEAAQQVLIALLEDQEPVLVAFAALALHRNGYQGELYKKLVQILKEGRDEYQSLISWTLVEICSRSKIPFLRKFADNTSDEKIRLLLDDIIHGISVKFQN